MAFGNIDTILLPRIGTLVYHKDAEHLVLYNGINYFFMDDHVICITKHFMYTGDIRGRIRSW